MSNSEDKIMSVFNTNDTGNGDGARTGNEEARTENNGGLSSTDNTRSTCSNCNQRQCMGDTIVRCKDAFI